MLLPDYFESWYSKVRLLGRTDATAADMRSFCRCWERSMGPVDIAEIDLPTAANFLRAARLDHSAPTCNKYRGYLLALLRDARRQRLTKARWFRQLPRMPENLELPTAWDREQVERLLIAAGAEPGEICEIPACHWWSALLLLILNSAFRINACLSIRSCDVDLQRGFLVCRAGRQKQRAGQFVRLGERTIKAISDIYSPTRIWLFPWPECPKSLFKHFSRICELAQIPYGGHSGLFHRARCTAISHAWLVSPEWARQLAGHANIDTTRKYYVDPRVAAPRTAPLF